MKRLLITGASRGIGRAVALAFHEREPGAELVLLGRASAAQDETARKLAERGARVTAFACDLADRASVDSALAKLEAGPAPDVVVHNAAVIERQVVGTLTDDSWDRQLEVNLTAPLRITNQLLPSMRARGSGRILFVSSISAVLGTKAQAAYHASKAGLVGAMRCLAEELTDSGLMTMALLPGSVDTRMLQGSGFPPRMTTEDVAKTLAHYAFDAPLAHNGASIEMFGT